jgi:hypothetical protein
MKKNYLILVMAFSAITLFTITGCKKSAADEADYTADFTVQSEDQTFVSAEDDAVSNDANTIIEADTAFAGGRTESSVCDASITRSSTSASKILTITYYGQNCAGKHTRTGVVILTLPKEKRWKDAGAQLSITYQNLKISRVGDNKSIILNGTKTITNVSGGELASLATLRTITHSITSSALSITFDDGAKRDWQIAKQRVFTYNNNGIVVSTRGTHIEGTASNISEWGTNRLGKVFSTRIAEPLVIRKDCDFRLVSGKIVYSNLQSPVTITFGLNAAGAATTCPGTGRYYYKIDWTGVLNVAHSIILPY